MVVQVELQQGMERYSYHLAIPGVTKEDGLWKFSKIGDMSFADVTGSQLPIPMGSGIALIKCRGDIWPTTSVSEMSLQYPYHCILCRLQLPSLLALSVQEYPIFFIYLQSYINCFRSGAQQLLQTIKKTQPISQESIALLFLRCSLAALCVVKVYLLTVLLQYSNLVSQIFAIPHHPKNYWLP